MPTHHKLKVARTAHYYTIGKPGKHIETCWIACHGYGQLAKTFVHRFKQLDDGKTLVIVPQGLNMFYWGEFSKDRTPVATWMTKENRLDEIEDYTAYLKSLYDLFIPQLAEDVQINMLGFSQGTQTQFRWLLGAQPPFHHLILWAGLVPDDLDYMIYADYLSDKQLHFIYGTEDPIIKQKWIDWQTNFAKKNGLEFQINTFAGEHVVDRKALLELKDRIARK